ncbi:MAG: chemotaxis protein CheA [Oscillospiraceae bacterium]|nr:chemotaxis protein CheA [Oscillospiraceae bacterium]
MRDDSLLEVFLFESQQLLDNLEGLLLEGEKNSSLDSGQVDEVFRIMHTIKGSSSMMSFDNLYRISHSVEDLFSRIRDLGDRCPDWNGIFNMVLSAVDFIKLELSKLQSGGQADRDPADIISGIEEFVKEMPGADGAEKKAAASAAAQPPAGAEAPEPAGCRPCYKIKVQFDDGCQMEQIRALGIVKALEKLCVKIVHQPDDLESEASREAIVSGGFTLYVQSGENPDTLKKVLAETLFIRNSSVIPLEDDNDELPEQLRAHKPAAESAAKPGAVPSGQESIVRQNFISVNVNKLDSLLDLVGELVTTEAMVTKNPDLAGLQLSNFETASRQLKNLTSELQGIVMSIRMLPLSTVFHKMQRIVRDTSKKLSKKVDLVLIGEETEVDKNIIDNLSDPLMHLIRNSVDHGIETPAERLRKGKPETGRVTLEAKNVGEDVVITVSDDGAGLDRAAILKKAVEKGLMEKADGGVADKALFSCIFLPGFSTKESVTEFSGRGVGMDVVHKSVEKLGGSICVESRPGQGTVFTIRIPLTLAIVDGMRLIVGPLSFIVPMVAIREAFVPDAKDVFIDPDGNEMIMIRGECYPILRLYEFFGIDSAITDIADGILVLIESDSSTLCIFVDKLIGEQQVVVKPFPEYIQKIASNLDGVSGCTILGDGRISLIINVNNLLRK